MRVYAFFFCLPFAGTEEKQECIKTLLNEQQNLCHQAAENCLSLQNLKRILYVYNRYFIALSRFKVEQQQVEESKVMSESHAVTVETKANVSEFCVFLCTNERCQGRTFLYLVVVLFGFEINFSGFALPVECLSSVK